MFVVSNFKFSIPLTLGLMTLIFGSPAYASESDNEDLNHQTSMSLRDPQTPSLSDIMSASASRRFRK